MNTGPYPIFEVTLKDLSANITAYGVTISDPKKGKMRWIWDAGSEGDTYRVTLSADEGFLTKLFGQKQKIKIRDMDCKVSCNCPAFLYWGSDYNASEGGYLDKSIYYPMSKARGRAPMKRDPFGKNLICKHIAAVYQKHKQDFFP